MMNTRKQHKRKRYGKVIALYLLLISLAAGGLIYLIKTSYFEGSPIASVEKTVNRVATKTAIEKVVQAQTGQNIDIDEMRNQMTEEDAEEFDEIVDKYATSENVSKAAELAISGDSEAAQNFINENVDETDLEAVKELYEKYKEQIPQE